MKMNLQTFNITVEMKLDTDSVATKKINELKLAIAAVFAQKLKTETFIGNVTITHVKK